MSTPDYSANDPRGWMGDPSRGAALGRPTILPDAPAEFTGRIYLRRERLDSGGYDRNGTYFGLGAPLYWYASEDGEIDAMTRASDLAAAQATVRATFPNAVFTATVVDNDWIDTMFAAYVECALWSSTDESDEAGGSPMDENYDESDVEAETLTWMRGDCASFMDRVAAAGLDAARLDPEQTGHDLWLTRNGHGAGFWDRGLGSLGDKLSDLAGALGEAYLYVTDDGRISR